jgi:hypothetical protein
MVEVLLTTDDTSMCPHYRSFLLLVLLCTFGPLVRCQEWATVDPSMRWLAGGLPAAPVVLARAFDADSAHRDDERRDRDGRMPLYARFASVDIDPWNSGIWTDLGNGDRIWRVELVSSGALAVEAFLADVHLPPGGVLYFHDPQGDQLQGGYTAAHVAPDGYLTTLPIMGERVVLEYFEPRAVAGQGDFRVTDLAHTYRFLEEVRTGACQVDVNCSEGGDWSAQRDAVVRIRIVIPSGAGFCTGTLMNNTAQDCTPYILTAFHCGEESVSANFSQYQFLFNYQRACGSGTAPASQLITGCQRRADSNDSGPEGGGTYGSDFMLLQLNSVVPASFNAYYAGWEATVFVPEAGVCIHHAAGDFKKISTYTTALGSSSWAGFTVGSHWRVTWTATANGHGVTEPGSSGAPLFNASKRVIGTLTGGSSCCTSNGCGPQTGLNQPDYFGKVNYHWNENPNPAEEKLRLFLSPTGNVVTLNGSYAPCGAIGVDEVRGPDGHSIHVTVLHGHLIVRAVDQEENGSWVSIIDPTGRVVHEERMGRSGLTFRMEDRPSGVYFVRSIGAGCSATQRIHFIH